MNRGMHRKLWAILGASVLTLGVVGIALAVELKDAHQGIIIGWDENGDPFNDGGIQMLADCDGVVPGEGEIAIHFVQSGQSTNVNDGGLSANNLDVDFNGATDQTGVDADSIQNDSNVDWYVWTSSAGGDVEIVTAVSDVPGGEDDLRISHICVGDEPGEETTPPTDTPTSSPAATDTPTEVPTEVPTATPFQSVNDVTDAPTETPFQSVEGDTDEPSEPDTATIGGSKDLGSPAEGAWLLVVALGVLLASIVVLTPARAKAPRR